MEIDKESNFVLGLVMNNLSSSYLDNNILLNLYTTDENEDGDNSHILNE